MSKLLANKIKENEKKTGYIDIEAYQWTKEQTNKSFQDNLIYGAIIISGVAVFITFGYLIVQKITV